MSSFTERELAYQLLERHLARHATVGADGMPQVAPVGFSYNADLDGIEVRGHTLERTKKFRDVANPTPAVTVNRPGFHRGSVTGSPASWTGWTRMRCPVRRPVSCGPGWIRWSGWPPPRPPRATPARPTD